MHFCHRGKNEINEESDGNSHENTFCNNIKTQLKEHFLFWKHYEVVITVLLPALGWPHLEQFWAPECERI